jgi:citrate lyase subunit beta/citryl-CoA lyase
MIAEYSTFKYNNTYNQVTSPKRNSIRKGLWPGIEIYYPPIKYSPKNNRYETYEEAIKRFEKYVVPTTASTVIFDLEDGCSLKEDSRSLLLDLLPKIGIFKKFFVAIRINSFHSKEYYKDIKLIEILKEYIDIILLPKVGVRYGISELNGLADWVETNNINAEIEPIIEHPKSLKLIEKIFEFDIVNHVVFGIHDFSKALGVFITPTTWMDDLRVWRDLLLTEASLHGKGVIGGVETLIGNKIPENLINKERMQIWLNSYGDKQAQTVYNNATQEARFGFTGKQVIHPQHILLCQMAFSLENSMVRQHVDILNHGIDSNALHGGAILYNGEMIDPPMFGKSLQVLLRTSALNMLDNASNKELKLIISKLPVNFIKDNWYFELPPFVEQDIM